MKVFAGFVIFILAFLPQNKRNTWYTVKFQSLCDELERPVTPERAARLGTLKAYDIQQKKIAPDTTLVSFDFISNCCETHTGNATIINGTLNLNYYQTNSEACRCLCDYRLTYTISDTTRHWASVKVRRFENKK
jgi:hypothetical protein